MSRIAEQYRVFARFYDRWLPEPERDIPFWLRRAREAGGPVVELGVGTGRVAIPLAREGVHVTGVDASPDMLARGGEKAEAAGVLDRLSLIEADFRSFVADPPVGLVFIPVNSFLHLTSTGEQLATLASAYRSLRPGGRFIASVFVPDPAFVAANDGRRSLQSSSVDDDGALVEIWSTPAYDATTQVIDERVEAEVRATDGSTHTVEWRFTMRMVYRYEMEHLLARAGFETEALYGDYDDGPLTSEKRRMIWVARRP